jgi:hypothetical protein
MRQRKMCDGCDSLESSLFYSNEEERIRAIKFGLDVENHSFGMGCNADAWIRTIRDKMNKSKIPYSEKELDFLEEGFSELSD